MVPSVSSSLDVDAVLGAALDSTVGTVRADGGWIVLGDESALDVVCRRGVAADRARAVTALAARGGALLPALREGEAVIIEGAASASLVPQSRPRDGLSTLLVLPLKAQGNPLGLLVAVSRTPKAFSAHDVRAARAACDESAIAIERALVCREQLTRIERQRLLLEAAETVNRSLDSLSLETTILAEATRLMGAQRSALLVVRGDVLVAQEVRGFAERSKDLFVVPLEGSPFGQAVVTGETVTAGDAGSGEVHAAELAVGERCRAFIAAPLHSCRGTSGVIALFYDAPQRFGDDERMLLRTFAVQAAIALDNRRLMREKDQMAVRDGLTGVYNRSYLELTLERTTKELRRNGGVVSILFLDIDDMKQVNDTHGHPAGDRLLCALAKLLRENCREADIVARYGGDEFVVLMPGTDAEGAHRVSLKVGEAIDRHNSHEAGPTPLLVSMGVHTAGRADVDDLLREADRRMYAVKRRGRAAG
ncbi:MAG TPA: diguanylate cyclase [Thermoleophilia bacterium]|nr:diguanylate cyclase [Thermoleophilia bacterium]